ncbi:MAG: calcium/sodium antiporter [Candidatus Brocadiia bacterium]
MATAQFLESPPAVMLLLAVGMVLVIKGGDLFVTSSVSIAYYARIPQAVIGSTLVSLATTAPELAVSATASFRGNPGLAIGNAVGSAIANIGLILGLLCILRAMSVRARDFRVPSLTMLGAGVLMVVLTLPLRLARASGILLLACGAGYLAADYWRHRPRPGAMAETVDSSAGPSMSLRKSLAVFLIGAAVVVGGSRLLSDNAVKLATAMGVPPMIIGLTLVAFGTSLPELVTAITAARKGVPQLSLGNVVGANILNITLVTGTAATITPLTMSRTTQAYNFPAMVAIFVLLLVLARTGRRLTHKEGWVLLAFYALYLVGLILIRE